MPVLTDTATDCPVRPKKPAADWPPCAERWSNGVDWRTVLWASGIHAGALAAPFCFTWKALLLTLLLAYLTGGLGICLGYHRLLTHGGFQTYRPVRWLLAWLGSLAGEGPPIFWVGMHRKHHQYSDQPGDPHSPHEGPWWSHMLWLFPRPDWRAWDATLARYAPDILRDPFMRMLDGTFLAWHLALGLALFLFGWFGWGLATGVSFLVWGMFVRMVYVLHVTWLVNSASHMWGYRNYETPDNSRNLWWVGLLAYGEGWHNNHHAFQRGARHGHRWWEFDLTYGAILVLERLGLAWKVVRDFPPDSRVKHRPPAPCAGGRAATVPEKPCRSQRPSA
jgi:fatty-acid desaturase